MLNGEKWDLLESHTCKMVINETSCQHLKNTDLINNDTIGCWYIYGQNILVHPVIY